VAFVIILYHVDHFGTAFHIVLGQYLPNITVMSTEINSSCLLLVVCGLLLVACWLLLLAVVRTTKNWKRSLILDP
jgi:thiosulfate reductase cytochrome b subunit